MCRRDWEPAVNVPSPKWISDLFRENQNQRISLWPTKASMLETDINMSFRMPTSTSPRRQFPPVRTSVRTGKTNSGKLKIQKFNLIFKAVSRITV